LSLFKFVALGFASLVALSPVTAFALEDGWYHAVDVKGSCPEGQSAVMYLESDIPLSVSVTGGSAQAEERKKLTPSKVNFTFNAGAQRATLQIWKGKNNQILSKVTQSNLCMGAEITFAK